MTDRSFPSFPIRLRVRRSGALACLLATLLQCAGPAAFAQDDTLPDTSTLQPGPVREVLPASPEPFRAGESLRFSIQYGFIKAGTRVARGARGRGLERPPVLAARGARRVERVLRQGLQGAQPHRVGLGPAAPLQLALLRGPARGPLHGERHAHVRPRLGAQVRYKNGSTYAMPPEVQDALSAFYYTRFQALPLGGSITFDYHASRKSAPMEVRVLGRQRIKTPAGRFNCVVIEPMLKAGGIFKNKGRLVIWLTDDARRMPVLMRSKVLIGSISVMLQEAKTGDLMSRYREADLSRLTIASVADRPTKVTVGDFARPARPRRREGGARLAARPARRAGAARGRRADRGRAPRRAARSWRCTAGHVVKVGVSPCLIALLERGVVTHLATNGAGAHPRRRDRAHRPHVGGRRGEPARGPLRHGRRDGRLHERGDARRRGAR